MASHAGESPQDYLDDGSDGLQARGPIAASAGNRPVFIAEAWRAWSTNHPSSSRFPLAS